MLLCSASAIECRAIAEAFGATPPPLGGVCGLSASCDLLMLGVGPLAAGVNAALALSRGHWDAVVNLGIAGTYDPEQLGVLSRIAATVTLIGDIGLCTPQGFVTTTGMGFPPHADPDWNACDAGLLHRFRGVVDHAGPIATVACASGTDEAAGALRARTRAQAEAMEGAAVHLACRRTGLPFAEIRVISNRVGDRARHPWKLNEALTMLGVLARDVDRAWNVC
jgi:futalosine hydrolase